jgi:hypothetical protein
LTSLSAGANINNVKYRTKNREFPQLFDAIYRIDKALFPVLKNTGAANIILPERFFLAPTRTYPNRVQKPQ